MESKHPSRANAYEPFLFYLATELKPVPRTTLAWLFWPDKSPQVASRNLSIHLSYLKNALSEDAVISSQGTIALAEDVESDARDYFAFANNPNRNGDHNPLGLFRGPFLDGFSIKDADPFDQWVSSEAQQWRNRSIDAALERSFDLEIQKAIHRCTCHYRTSHFGKRNSRRPLPARHVNHGKGRHARPGR